MSAVNNGPQIVQRGLVLDLDASYMRSYSPNVIPNPTDLFAWTGTAQNACTLSRDTSITRQYGSIPLKMAITGNDPYTGTYNSLSWNLAPAANGQTWTLSFYAKASESITGNCYIFGANSNGNYIEAPSTSFTVTNTWQRFTFTTTFANASTVYVQARVGGPATGGSGKTIWWDGLQLEKASSATTFNPYYIGNTTWRDVSGNNNNLTLFYGPTFDTSNGGCILFDGVNDLAATVAAPTYGNNMTWEAWVNRTSSVNAYNMFMGAYLPYFGLKGDGTVIFSNYINSTQQTIYSTGFTNANNVWYHLAFTTEYIGGNTASKIYIYGVLNNSSTFTGTQNSTSYQFAVGDGQATSWYPFNGKISNVKVYNRTLSAAEISKNYEATRKRFGL